MTTYYTETDYMKPDLDEVLKAVSKAFQINSELILSHRRTAYLINPRFVAFKLLRQRGYSLVEIGRAFKRDHSGIYHGIKELSNRVGEMESHWRLARPLRELEVLGHTLDFNDEEKSQ